MRFLIRLTSDLERESLLTTVRRLAKSAGSEAKNPKWTSYGALEVDIFSPSKADFGLFLATLAPMSELEFAKDLDEAPAYRAEDRLFSEARALFNSERYWECHEILEGLWKQKQGDEKSLLQGIILVCAAFVHHQKQEDGIALGVLARADKQLQFHRPDYGGFDLPDLAARVKRILDSRTFSQFLV